MKEESNPNPDPISEFNPEIISYEDEGFQLGLHSEEAQKKERQAHLQSQKAAVTTEHQALKDEWIAGGEAYRALIDQLIGQELLQKIDELDERRKASLRDMVLARSGMRFLLRDMDDKEQKEKLINMAINEFIQLMEECKEVVRKLLKKIEEQLAPELQQAKIDKHFETQQKLVEALLDTFSHGELLEKGYSYGNAVGRLFEAKQKS